MVSSDLGKLEASRHFTSGMDCAMAGAASVALAATAAPPTPAERKNLRRCMTALLPNCEGAGLWHAAPTLKCGRQPQPQRANRSTSASPPTAMRYQAKAAKPCRL